MIPLAVFGDPIGHSLSPQLHQIFARQAGLSVNYQAILSPSATFAEQVREFFVHGGVGANVTLPHKTRVLSQAASLSQRARLAGAANTLMAMPDMGAGSFHADNTDGEGLLWDLSEQLGSLHGMRVLIIGAGGAVRGILGPLAEAGCDQIVIHNRTPGKVVQLMAQLSVLAGEDSKVVKALCAFDDTHVMQRFDIVINAVSAGHQGSFPMPLQPHWLADAKLAYDLSYGKAAKPFFSAVKAQKADLLIKDGLGMLVGQGAASFRLWTGAEVKEADALRELRRFI